MKRFFLALMVAVLAIGASAQVVDVPNGDFENWNGGIPESWTTNISGNVIVPIPYIGDFPYPPGMRKLYSVLGTPNTSAISFRA